jgi:hypothetical protein
MKIIIDIPESATQGKPWDYARVLRNDLDREGAGIISGDNSSFTPIRSEWVIFEIGGGFAGI